MTIPASLEQLIGPPAATPTTPDWDEIYSEYGLVFPPDYQAFVERYPLVEFYEFLAVYHPTSPIWNLFSVMGPQLEDAREYLRRTREPAGGFDPQTGLAIPAGPPVDYRFYPEPGGLVPWGVTVNEGKCLWLTHEDPEQWTVVIANDYRGWWHYRGPLTHFLRDILTARFVCPIFGDHFPDEWAEEGEIRQVTDKIPPEM
ncbi:hypothetical protein [Actinomadura sp. HBU206391]|uniref:hypothetical protein n=1 Tax=Actinomadura sp. HBU206391 TaxID=2731692 RepID=UPI00164EE783|nr:hypothetical protein [Actinomadura sp. HBU206391]MBC6463516.1 hypothetical protein [Actinomadura sp. HBU206391]